MPPKMPFSYVRHLPYLIFVVLSLCSNAVSSQETESNDVAFQHLTQCFALPSERQAKLTVLESRYPELIRIVDIGESFLKATDASEGHDLFAIELSTGGADKPKLIVQSAIHGNELGTADLAFYWISFLGNQYGVDPQISRLLQDIDIHVIVDANPDATHHSITTGIRTRGNLNSTYCATEDGMASVGVDLNRNHSFDWGAYDNPTLYEPCEQGYQGPAPASEPETQAVEAYLINLLGDTDHNNDSEVQNLFLDIHSTAGLIIWPDSPAITHTFKESLQTLATSLASLDTNMRALAGSSLYTVDGTTDAFVAGHLNTPALTIELRGENQDRCAFFTESLYHENLTLLLKAAGFASEPLEQSQLPQLKEMHIDAISTDNRIFLSGELVNLVGNETVQITIESPLQTNTIDVSSDEFGNAFFEVVLEAGGWPQGKNSVTVTPRRTVEDTGVSETVSLYVLASGEVIALEFEISSQCDDEACAIGLEEAFPAEELSFQWQIDGGLEFAGTHAQWRNETTKIQEVWLTVSAENEILNKQQILLNPHTEIALPEVSVHADCVGLDCVFTAENTTEQDITVIWYPNSTNQTFTLQGARVSHSYDNYGSHSVSVLVRNSHQLQQFYSLSFELEEPEYTEIPVEDININWGGSQGIYSILVGLLVLLIRWRRITL